MGGPGAEGDEFPIAQVAGREDEPLSDGLRGCVEQHHGPRYVAYIDVGHQPFGIKGLSAADGGDERRAVVACCIALAEYDARRNDNGRESCRRTPAYLLFGVVFALSVSRIIRHAFGVALLRDREAGARRIAEGGDGTHVYQFAYAGGQAPVGDGTGDGHVVGDELFRGHVARHDTRRTVEYRIDVPYLFVQPDGVGQRCFDDFQRAFGGVYAEPSEGGLRDGDAARIAYRKRDVGVTGTEQFCHEMAAEHARRPGDGDASAVKFSKVGSGVPCVIHATGVFCRNRAGCR